MTYKLGTTICRQNFGTSQCHEENLDEESDGSLGDWAKLQIMQSSHSAALSSKLPHANQKHRRNDHLGLYLMECECKNCLGLPYKEHQDNMNILPQTEMSSNTNSSLISPSSLSMSR
ncbi:Uncharacterized protein Fot_07326 [Forsythia ovata]|uniref:Uncharacterized protein n=1 Tax=Forsythia ovata TaxID=205694 RepID=A0ABD1WVH0_9LAMI